MARQRTARGDGVLKISKRRHVATFDVRFGSKADMTGEFAMSAIHPKADIAKHCWDVRFVPKADISISLAVSAGG